MEIKIEIPPREMQRAMQDLSHYESVVSKEIQAAVVRSTYRAGGRARKLAPSSNGKLIQSIVEKTGILKGEIAVNAQHAGSVEFGSKPHIIKPKTKKALAFKPGAGFRSWDESGRIVVKSVKHPGTKAQPYLRPAMEAEAPLFANTIKSIIEKAANR